MLKCSYFPVGALIGAVLVYLIMNVTEYRDVFGGAPSLTQEADLSHAQVFFIISNYFFAFLVNVDNITLDIDTLR